MIKSEVRPITSTVEALQTYERDGFAIIKGFYDIEREIRPIQEGIRTIVELVAGRHGLKVACSTPEEAMTKGQMQLIAADRRFGGEVYDAVKQIPGLMALVSNPRNMQVFKQLRPGAVPGVAGGGYGIRIDYPGEEKFRSPWHQDYLSHFRSLDGIVYWSPLLPVTPEMGPVILCPGSHAEGAVPVYKDDRGVGRSGAYALIMDREGERLAKYDQVAPLSEPGDLILIDYLTLHASGANVSTNPRWSMQWRIFNFVDPTGIRIGWRGGLVVGTDFSQFLPELLIDKPKG
jgi:hypothetical protein